jgi:excisionase family DNA binding protein
VDVLTVPQIALELGISRSLAYDLVARGEIRALRIGQKTVRVRREALEEFLRARETGSGVEAAS